MEVTKAVKVALNTLADIANHSANGRLVSAPEIARRLHISISRLELLLRPLREAGLIAAIKGRAGGYQLSKDPQNITIKDIVLAMNSIKKRKVEVSEIAKELYQSLEAYMVNYLSNSTLGLVIKDHIPRFTDVQIPPERKSYLPMDAEMIARQEKRLKGEVQKVIKARFKKAEEMPRGPNSIFSFADYINKTSSNN